MCTCTYMYSFFKTTVDLQADSALLYLSGELHFLNNSGGKESALEMLSFAQVVLSRGLYVNFEGNSGRSVSLSMCKICPGNIMVKIQ